MTRESLVRCGVLRLFFQRLGHGSRNARLMLRLALVLPDLVSIFGTFPGAFLDLALLRRRQVDTGPSRLRKAVVAGGGSGGGTSWAKDSDPGRAMCQTISRFDLSL